MNKYGDNPRFLEHFNLEQQENSSLLPKKSTSDSDEKIKKIVTKEPESSLLKNKNLSKSKSKSLTNLRVDLKKEVHQRELKKFISAGHLSVKEKEPNSSRKSSLNLQHQKLGNSSNPVALLKEEKYIPKKLLKSQIEEKKIEIELADFKSPLFFNKEELISNFLLLPSDTNFDLKKFKETHYQLHYISSDALLNYFTINKLGDLSLFTKNLVSYFKASDLKSHAAINQMVDGIITDDLNLPSNQRQIPSAPMIVYKGGRENLRELLATRKALLEGYGDVIHIKEKIKEMDELELSWGAQSITYPIKSEFLEGFEHISNVDWTAWGQARQAKDLAIFNLAQAIENQAPSQEIEEMKQKCKEVKKQAKLAEKKILNYAVDPTSVCKLAFYETKINASDFHTGQFMIGPNQQGKHKKQMISVDEGRWGNPGIGYSYSLTIKPSVAVTFKNSLLTHPDCLKPVPAELREFLKERLKTIDETFNEMVEKKLVWSEQEFNQLETSYTTITETLSLLKRNKLTLPQVIENLKKFDIAFEEKEESEQLKTKLENYLNDQKNILKERAFSKQSIKSLYLEKQREQIMANYILSKSSASIYQAFEIGYPELATFMTILRRIYADPGKELSLVNNTMPRSLSSIIELAKGNKTKSPSASTAELEKMGKDLEKIKKESTFSKAALALTSDAG